jgi:hypothetical protein
MTDSMHKELVLNTWNILRDKLDLSEAGQEQKLYLIEKYWEHLPACENLKTSNLNAVLNKSEEIIKAGIAKGVIHRTMVNSHSIMTKLKDEIKNGITVTNVTDFAEEALDKLVVKPNIANMRKIIVLKIKIAKLELELLELEIE